jgi:hypothetical protein
MKDLMFVEDYFVRDNECYCFLWLGVSNAVLESFGADHHWMTSWGGGDLKATGQNNLTPEEREIARGYKWRAYKVVDSAEIGLEQAVEAKINELVKIMRFYKTQTKRVPLFFNL